MYNKFVIMTSPVKLVDQIVREDSRLIIIQQEEKTG